MLVRPIESHESEQWLALRQQLWPDTDRLTHEQEVDVFAGNRLRSEAFVCMNDDGAWVGFIELSIRPSVIGIASGPVGFIEGIFVKPQFRRLGMAQALIGAGEDWARRKGCRCMATDVDLDNTESQVFHAQSGFREVDRVVIYAREIPVQAAPSAVHSTLTAAKPARDISTPTAVVTQSQGLLMPSVVIAALVAVVLIFVSDINSSDVLAGALYPMLGALAVFYVGVGLAIWNYKRKTNERDRRDALFSVDQED